jgi:hypothetical protein
MGYHQDPLARLAGFEELRRPCELCGGVVIKLTTPQHMVDDYGECYCEETEDDDEN